MFANNSRVAKASTLKRDSYIRAGIYATLFGVTLLVLWWRMIRMPGQSFSGPPPTLSDSEQAAFERMGLDLNHLCKTIGERNVSKPGALDKAAQWIALQLQQAGHSIERQSFRVGEKEVDNIIAQIGDDPSRIVVVGAHYDSVYGTPGANDNGTGVVALLELARRFHQKSGAMLRFVFFVNEEPPFFRTDEMGSAVYANSLRAKNENVVAMFSLETMGYYSSTKGSQRYPFPLSLIYPDTGNFIGFVANQASRDLLFQTISSFRQNASVPSEGAALPAFITGVAWSDHASFWDVGYPAIEITDTAPFRYPHYHTNNDTVDKVDMATLARVVSGLEQVITETIR